MVLSTPAPDTAPAAPAWLERLSLILRLAGRSVLVLIDRARPERLGDLVRHLVRERPETEVLIDAQSLVTVPEGSTVVLCMRAIDSDWLNQERPIVQSRALRLVLFSDDATTLHLAQTAVDFYDWISHRIECPEGPPAFAIRAFRRAACARAPAIVWQGGDLEGTFAEVLPGRTLTRVTAAVPYPALVEALRPTAKKWVAVMDLASLTRTRRVAWAAAEAGRRGRLVLLDSVSAPLALPRVGARALTIEEGTARLSAAGVERAARLAALLELSPEAIDDAAKRARSGTGEAELLEIALRATDPVIALGSLDQTRKLEDTRRKESPTEEPATGQRWSFHLPFFPERIEIARKAGDLDVAAHWAEAWRRTTGGVRSIAALARIRFSQQAIGEAQRLLREARSQVANDASNDTRLDLRRAEGMECMAKGDFLKASRFIAESLDLAERLGRDQGEQDELYGLLIQCLVNTGRTEDAELKLYQWMKKKNILERRLWDPRLARAAANLKRAQGDTLAAAGFLEQILARWPTTEVNHPNRSAIEQSLAQVWFEQRRFREAEQLLREAIQRLEQIGHSTIGLHHDLGKVLYKLGRFREAEDEFHRVIEEEALESSSVDPTVYDLTLSISAQGRLDEAEALIDQLIERTQRDGATNLPHYARAIDEKARILRKKGDLPGAETMMREALRLKDLFLGRDNPRVLPSLVELGEILIAINKPREAEPLLRRATRLAEKVGDRTGTAAALTGLARAQARLGFQHASDTARRSFVAWSQIAPELTPALRRELEAIAAGILSSPPAPPRQRR